MAQQGRPTNFNPGPAVLPLEVMKKAQEELLDLRGCGLSILETSHRSKDYEAVHNETIAKIRKLLGVGDEFRVLFMGGGASTQFAIVPMNYLTRDTSADYIVTGAWGEKAVKEAKLHGKVNVAATTEDNKQYKRVPKQEELKLDPGAVYCHYTSNNTIFGTQWAAAPKAGVPLVCDMSSDFLSRPVEMPAHGIVYAGAQKNAGPAGVTIVLIHKDLLAKAREDIPIILRYKTHEKDNSLYNTPPCFAIYIVNLVMDWVLENGGLEGMKKRNGEKGKLLYGMIDKHPDFFRAPVEKDSRSLMNVVFRLPSEDLEGKFVSEGKAARFVGLKGHRSVGGIRVSMYNAISPEDIARLVQFMEDFVKKNG
jgi:phosphoserine aminotransferase